MNLKKATEYEEITCSATWIRKMRTLFRRLDTHGHGYVSVEDLIDVASRVLTAFPKSDNFFGDQVVQAMVHLWYGVICNTGSDQTRTSVHLNEAGFVEGMKKCINTTLKNEFVNLMVKPFFDIADTDKDGMLLQNEFAATLVSWRANEKEAELLFRIIDGGSKKIGIDQFEGVLAEYFFDEGIKGKTSKLWGALINYKRPEDYPECECGPTWEGKMRTMFRRLDVNQAGKLRCHDFIQIGRSLASRNHLSKHKADAVMRAMLDIWINYFSVDKEGNHFTELTEKEFIHNLRSMINGEFRHAIDQFGWTFFKAVEVEGTGFLSIGEYRNLQESWHVGRAEAEGMFKVLDSDKDGRISSDEYLSAWVDYFLGEDANSPYKTFFGPVISKPGTA